MDRLDMAIALIQEAKEEKERLVNYEKEYAEAWKLDREITDGDRWKNRNKVFNKYPRTPKKSVVNDNLKMARRLLVDEYM